MSNAPDDLTMRTVVYQGDIDQMGVVMRDGGGERVRVYFGDGRPDEAGNLGEYVDRDDLEDVTEMYDYAYQWGFTTENHADDD